MKIYETIKNEKKNNTFPLLFTKKEQEVIHFSLSTTIETM